MVQSSRSNDSQSDRSQVIALLLADLVDCTTEHDGPRNVERLQKTFGEAPGGKRLLVCIPDPRSPAEPLLGALAGLQVEKQFLLGQHFEQPQTGEFVVKAPPDMSRNELIKFALALSDVVLISEGKGNEEWAQYAEQSLGKTLVAIGSPVPALPADAVDVTKHLDPKTPGWHRWGQCLVGRPEQFMLECLALLSWGDGKKRKNRVWRSFWGWRPPQDYFAPKEWKRACPDKATEPLAALIGRFGIMDRSALYGSYIHRDITWIAYLGSAFAVLSAVAGHVFGASPSNWAGQAELSAIGGHVFAFIQSSWIEFGFLTWVLGLVIFAQWTRLQERWTACRLGAEQLRMVCMSLPLLVLPPAFATADAKASTDSEDPIDYELSAIGQVKRALRQQGLPRVDFGALTATEAARWIQLIVVDQMHYHEHNQHTLERAEKTLGALSTSFFLASWVMVVLVLFRHDNPLFFLATAAGPAFAAALHGAGTRLGFVHRAALSSDMSRQLKEISYSLDELIRTAASSVQAWEKVRGLTFEAAKAMGAENTSWHRLVRRYRDELP